MTSPRRIRPRSAFFSTGLQGFGTVLELPHDRLHLGEPAFGQRPQRAEELAHRRVREPVGHEQPLFVALHQPRAVQDAQMLGRVGDAQAGFARQAFHRAGALAQHIEGCCNRLFQAERSAATRRTARKSTLPVPSVGIASTMCRSSRLGIQSFGRSERDSRSQISCAGVSGSV